MVLYTILQAFKPAAFVLVAIGTRALALTVSEAVDKFTLVDLSVRSNLRALAIWQVAGPLSAIRATGSAFHDTHALLHVVFKTALVDI